MSTLASLPKLTIKNSSGVIVAINPRVIQFTGGITVAKVGSEVHVTLAGGGSNPIAITWAGTPIEANTSLLNLTGTLMSTTSIGVGQVKVESGQGINIYQNYTLVLANAKKINFTGGGVTASGPGSIATINITAPTLPSFTFNQYVFWDNAGTNLIQSANFKKPINSFFGTDSIVLGADPTILVPTVYNTAYASIIAGSNFMPGNSPPPYYSISGYEYFALGNNFTIANPLSGVYLGETLDIKSNARSNVAGNNIVVKGGPGVITGQDIDLSVGPATYSNVFGKGIKSSTDNNHTTIMAGEYPLLTRRRPSSKFLEVANGTSDVARETAFSLNYTPEFHNGIKINKTLSKRLDTVQSIVPNFIQVPNTEVQANSLILVTIQELVGAAPTFICFGSITPGVEFYIFTDAGVGSKVGYVIING